MAEGINVRIPNEVMQQFIAEKTGPDGLYSSASEYIRELIRRDFEQEEQRRWDRLYAELKPALEADESEFVPLDVEKLIKIAHQEAQQKKATR